MPLGAHAQEGQWSTLGVVPQDYHLPECVWGVTHVAWLPSKPSRSPPVSVSQCTPGLSRGF